MASYRSSFHYDEVSIADNLSVGLGGAGFAGQQQDERQTRSQRQAVQEPLTVESFVGLDGCTYYLEPYLPSASMSPGLGRNEHQYIQSDFTMAPYHGSQAGASENDKESSYLRTTQVDRIEIHTTSRRLVNHNADRPFRPSRALFGEERSISLEVAEMMAFNEITINPNYQGDINLQNIFNAALPEHENCAVWVTRISPLASRKDIFDAIREGKVFNFSYHAPKSGQFNTAAAHIAFTDRAAAEAFIARANTWNGIRILGRKVHVEWNRDKSGPLSFDQRFQSRVVRVYGPKEMASWGVEDNFHKKIRFELVDKKDWVVGDRRVVELAFDSILGQSRAAVKCFNMEIQAAGVGHKFAISYAPDPCEPHGYYRRDVQQQIEFRY